MAKRNDQQPAHDGSTLREVHRTKTTRSRSGAFQVFPPITSFPRIVLIDISPLGCLICRARKVIENYKHIHRLMESGEMRRKSADLP